MRILMIAPEPFLEQRGTPLSVYHRIKALVLLGYEVDLITYSIGTQITLPGLNMCRAPALPFVHQVKIGPSLLKVLLDILVFLRAIWQLSHHRYHYLHTHEEAGVMGVVLAFLFRCKHLYDMHSDLSQQMSNFAFTKSTVMIQCVAAVQKFIVSQADAVITICPDLELTARQMAPAKPIYMIENVAVDAMLPPPQSEDIIRLRQQWKIEDDAPILLYTGTFESYQGIDLLLHSVVQVRSHFPTARYVLVGGTRTQVEMYCQLAQRLDIAEMICFVGQRPLEEMPAYMELADILLSPRSQGTNTPLKLYTYLRSGKAILATNILSHTQVLTTDMAKLVPPTPEGLAQGAVDLLQNREYARILGNHGRQVAEESYSWSAFLEKHRRAYREFTHEVGLSGPQYVNHIR